MEEHLKAQEAAHYLEKAGIGKPKIGVILGSGLGNFADEIEDAVEIPYKEIPHFPVSTVQSHKGQFVFGNLFGKAVLAMQGRVHYYEGYTMNQVIFPIRVMQKLGLPSLIITNAAGGINRHYKTGDFMLIADHINYLGTNPLIGSNEQEFGERFPDMSSAYDQQWISEAERIGRESEISLRKGIYIAVTGPSFETPAEIRMFEKIGADAVGMSTVPEVIAANHMGIEVLGISCITNMAAGVLHQKITSEEVIETAKRVRPDFIRLLKSLIKEK